MLRGRLDIATRTRISGWAQDDRLPHQPIALLVIDNEILLDRVVANRHRPDLEAGGIGDGRHGFDLRLEGGLPGLGQHVIRVVRERDGVELAASPALIAPAGAFDAHEASLLQSMLDGLASRPAIDAAVVTLSGQIERLLARRGFARAPERRALVIDTTMPASGRDAGSNAIFSHVASLARLGFAVSFAAADCSPPPTDYPGIDWRSKPIDRSVEEVLVREAGLFDLVYLHRLDAAAGYMPLVRLHQPKARVIYSVADLHHVRLARRGFSEREPSMVARARKVRDTEFAVAGAADVVLTHSHAEAALLRRSVGQTPVVVAPWHIMPAAPRRAVPAATIGFIGHFGHAPNVAAAHRLVFDIMPRLRRLLPGVACLIAGSAMPQAMRQWAAPKRDSPNDIEFLGTVADLTGFFARLTVTVAPMRYGAGIKGKLLDSLAAGVPCIATPVATEGLNWPEALDRCVATDDDAIAAAIVALCTNRQAYRKVVAAGRAMVAHDWSEDEVDTALAAAIKPVRAG